MKKVENIINIEKQKRELWVEAIKEIIPDFYKIEREAGGLSVWIDKDDSLREFFIYRFDYDLIYVRPKFDNFEVYQNLIEKDKTNYLVSLMRVYDMYIKEEEIGRAHV